MLNDEPLHILLPSSLSTCFWYHFLTLSLVNVGVDVQEGVAIEIAEAVVGALRGELAATAVNAPMVPAEVSLWNFAFMNIVGTWYQASRSEGNKATSGGRG